MFSLFVIFVVIMASFPQPMAASAHLGGILSAQTIMQTIKVQPPPSYEGEIDNEVIKD